MEDDVHKKAPTKAGANIVVKCFNRQIKTLEFYNK